MCVLKRICIYNQRFQLITCNWNVWVAILFPCHPYIESITVLSDCVCVCVCLSVKVWENLEHWQLERATGRLQIIQGSKNNNRLLLKPFDYKVMTIYIIHGYCFQTWEDYWGQLHTSKHNYYCITTIASKALHQIKHNWGSAGYNIEHRLQCILGTF